MTWIRVVATRFFQKKREELMEKSSPVSLSDKMWQDHSAGITIDKRIDIRAALQQMPNSRYRKVIEVLDLQDVRPELFGFPPSSENSGRNVWWFQNNIILLWRQPQ